MAVSYYIARRYCTIRRKQYHFCKMYIGASYSTAPFENRLLNEKFESVQSKISNFMKWYENIIGLDEIRVAQNKVLEAQDRFAAAQDKRREVTLELNEVKNKIKDLQEELATTSRGEEKYIVLITKEHKLLKEEIRLTEKFNLYEREERELFTTLTSAVKDSHERERIHANKTKYISIIGSVLGALIGITGSTINNRTKITEIKKMVLQTTEDSKRELAAVCAQLELASKSGIGTSIKTEEITKHLRSISETLITLKSDIMKSNRVQPSKSDENVNVSVIPIDETENENWWSLTNMRYNLITIFGVYILLRIFFF